MAEEMTVSTGRDYEIGCIRNYMMEHDLTGGQIAEIFTAGLCAAHQLRPAWFGEHRPDQSCAGQVTPEEVLRIAIVKIETCAHARGLSGLQIEAAFNAGLAAVAALRPDLFGPAAPAAEKAA